jgi:flavin reductase (DIM6/NTAB) family NADH-FMN oxidoreductase RutF
MTATMTNDLARTFKEVFSRLASGVRVVTFWRAGRLHGFTATSVTSVSMKPMRVLFCLSETSESYSCLAPGSAVGISILNADQRALSDRFASKAAPGAYDDIRVAEGADDAPLLDGALGHVTGIVADLIPSGDHAIVLCDVTSAHAESEGNPLLYCDRAYHSLRLASLDSRCPSRLGLFSRRVRNG